MCKANLNKINKVEGFLSEIERSCSEESFIKLALGNYSGKEEGLKKILIRQVQLKSGLHWQLTYRYKTKDIVKNVLPSDGQLMMKQWLMEDFRIATLFTKSFDYIYENIHDKKFVLRRTVSVHKEAQGMEHDKQKSRLVSSDATYLKGLGVTGLNGQVRSSRQDKFKQINQYVNLLKPILERQPKNRPFRVLDMGAGKGYLTFALYDYMDASGFDVHMVGVEMRSDLVQKANALAQEVGFRQLKFETGTIAQYDCDKTDMLIALHACDTATDDAILKGLKTNAEIIVTAPCCHKQVRREMERARVKNDIEFITRHGIYLEREAEMVTDALRILALEYSGYRVKAVEFVSDQHTPKNVMIIAEKLPSGKTSPPEIRQKIETSMQYFGIASHHLIDAIIK